MKHLRKAPLSRSTYSTRVPKLRIPWLFGIAIATLLMAFTDVHPVSASSSTQYSHTPPQVLDGRAKMTQPYDPNKMLRITIGLTPPHMDQERKLIDQLHDKTSPEFHKWLTPEEWDARFAPSAEDEQAVVDWAKSQGLNVTNRFADRLLVDIIAPVGTIEKAFNIQINTYTMNGETYYANDRDPEVPTALTHTIQSVMGLNSFLRLRPAHAGAQKQSPQQDFVAGPPTAAGKVEHFSGSKEKLTAAMKVSKARKANSVTPDFSNGYLDPTDLYSTQAYDEDALNAQGHCCNPFGNPNNSPPETTIALAAFADLDYNDIYSFGGEYPYLAGEWQKKYIDGQYTCTDSPGLSYDDGCFEVTLDTEWSLAMGNSFNSNPATTAEVLIYEGASYGDIADVYNQMVSDNQARVSSTSWGCAEFACFDGPTMDSLDGIFSKMVGQGWTLIAAVGDQGSTNGCGDAVNVQFPASDPNFIAAGGTTLSLYSGPYYDSEVAWTGDTTAGSCGGNHGGTGGGFSSHFGAPSYQSGFGYANRSVPDIAMNASSGQNVYFAAAGGAIGAIGTSLVAPELAGFFAQQNAYSLAIGNVCGSGSSPCAPIGNANYSIYAEGFGQGAPHYPFYDITSGCNSNDVTAFYSLTYYCASAGFDQTTGWGSINMLQLAWTINWYTAYANGGPTISFQGPQTYTWYNTDQTVSWTVNDNLGDRGGSLTGIAGFTQGWDSIASDTYSEATPGGSNSFYDGPDFKNATTGCLQTGTDNGCAGNVSQGCHTAYVQAWNNMGVASGIQSYGPICYDTVAPTVGITAQGTTNGSVYTSAVTFTVYSSDSTSGVQNVYYQLDGRTAYYTNPVTVTSPGTHTFNYFATDYAGNESTIGSDTFTIESLTSTALGVSANPITYGNSVTLTATVNASFGGAAGGTVSFFANGGSLGTATLAGGKASITTSAIPAGNVSLVAAYNGSGTDLASTSAAKAESVKQASSSTSLSSSVNPSPYDDPVTLTAIVKSGTTGTPTGSVTFHNGSASLGTVNLSGGKAVLTTSALTVGAHTITAIYSGSTDFIASTSPALIHTVSQATTTTAITSSANPSTYDEKVSLTITVKSSYGVPTGTVTLKSGASTVGSAGLSSGKVVFNLTSSSVGNVEYTAVFGGNTDYAASTSPEFTQEEEKAKTTITVASSLNPAAYDKAVTFTAIVEPGTAGTPTGSVTFRNGSATLATVNLTSNKAEYTTSALTVGSHNITAEYNGSTDYDTSTSSALTETIDKVATTTKVASSVNPSTYGEEVTFTATTTGPAGVPTGTVTFKNGGTVLGTVTLASGSAVLKTAALAVGNNSITAEYNGSADDNASTSSAFNQVVRQATTTTTLVSSLNPSTQGKTVTFSAVVKSSGGVPTGAVSFLDGSKKIGSANLSGGKASFSTSTLANGSHSIQAVYAGSTDFITSKSGVLVEKVNP